MPSFKRIAGFAAAALVFATPLAARAGSTPVSRASGYRLLQTLMKDGVTLNQCPAIPSTPDNTDTLDVLKDIRQRIADLGSSLRKIADNTKDNDLLPLVIDGQALDIQHTAENTQEVVELLIQISQKLGVSAPTPPSTPGPQPTPGTGDLSAVVAVLNQINQSAAQTAEVLSGDRCDPAVLAVNPEPMNLVITQQDGSISTQSLLNLCAAAQRFLITVNNPPPGPGLAKVEISGQCSGDTFIRTVGDEAPFSYLSRNGQTLSREGFGSYAASTTGKPCTPHM